MCNCGNVALNCQCFMSNGAIVIQFPALVKSKLENEQRIIEFEASCEAVDSEGDVITQRALLDGSTGFLKTGVIDQDHLSEFAKSPAYSLLGLGNSEDWILGKPLNVIDLGDGRTGVKAIIEKGKPKADSFWSSVSKGDIWRASIYGYPGTDTETGGCYEGVGGKKLCATRYLVKSFDWRSTAVTRSPINDNIKFPVKIVTAKSFASDLFKADTTYIHEKYITREDLRSIFKSHLSINCPSTKCGEEISIYNIREHFMRCQFLSYSKSDVYALALYTLATNMKLL